MANNGGSSVPKFSSFKPKPKKPTAQVNAEASSARGDARVDARPERRTDGEKQEVRLGSYRVEKPRSNRDRPRSPPQSPRDTDRHRNARRPDFRSREDRSGRHRHHTSNRDDEARRDRSHRHSFEDRPSDLYIIDLKGDLANLQYRQSNKWNVPLYYLFGSGSLVGHDPDVKIDRQLSNEHGFTLRYPPGKQVVRRVGVIEIDEMFKNPPKPKMASGDEYGSLEEDFLLLPKQKQDKGELSCPIRFHW